MKNMKKFTAMLLAVIMVLGMAMSASADETDSTTDGYTITITHNDAKQAHTYAAYQVFTGDLYGNVLSNIVWGSNVTEQGQAALEEKYEVTSAAALAEKIVTEDDAKAFAEAVEEYLTGTPASSTTTDNKVYTINVETAGYYLIKDVATVNTHDSYTRYMMKVVKDTSVSHKGTVPTVDKQITNTGTEDTETGDFNIGDTVNYSLIGTLPSNYADYTTYKYVFHDTLTSGLTYNEDAKVYVVNGEVKTDVTVSFEVKYAGNKLTVSIDNLKTVDTVDTDSKIVVEYTCKLNADAVVGDAGNPNIVKLEFSNDPNYGGDGETPTTPPPTGETPEDTVVVFTFELDVTKVDGKDATKKLQGAEFKLRNEDGKWVTVDADGKVTGWDVEEKGSVLTSDENGFFTISGLEDGTYYLKETKAPDGYNLLPNEIVIVITSTYDEDGVEALTIKVDNGEEKPGTLSNGIVDTTVENNAGATLPETGGIGTTIFYIAGAVLVLAAIVLLVTKRRMKAE